MTEYFVRIRGRVSGPVPLTRLQQLVKAGRLKRIHEVSQDRVNWVTAAEMSDLFPARRESERGLTAKEDGHGRDARTAQSTAGQAQWYVTSNGNQLGPMPRATLHEMLVTGQLDSDCLVWRDGMADWAPIFEVRELGLQHPDPRARPKGGSAEGELIDDPVTVDRLQSTAAWSLFLSTVLIIFALFTVISGIWSTATGVNDRNSARIVFGLFAIVDGVVMGIGWYWLDNLRRTLKYFTAYKTTSGLRSLAGSLHSLVVYTAIIVILVIAFVITVVIYAYAAAKGFTSTFG